MKSIKYFYIFRDGEPIGPYAQNELEIHLKEGSIAPDEQACIAGTEDWKPAIEFSRVPIINNSADLSAKASGGVAKPNSIPLANTGAVSAKPHLGPDTIPLQVNASVSPARPHNSTPTLPPSPHGTPRPTPTRPILTGGGVPAPTPTRPILTGGGVPAPTPTRPILTGGGVPAPTPTRPIMTGGGAVAAPAMTLPINTMPSSRGFGETELPNSLKTAAWLAILTGLSSIVIAVYFMLNPAEEIFTPSRLASIPSLLSNPIKSLQESGNFILAMIVGLLIGVFNIVAGIILLNREKAGHGMVIGMSIIQIFNPIMIVALICCLMNASRDYFSNK